MTDHEVRAYLQRQWHRQLGESFTREYLELQRLVTPGAPDRFQVQLLRPGGEVWERPNRSQALAVVHRVIGDAWVEVCMRCRVNRGAVRSGRDLRR